MAEPQFQRIDPDKGVTMRIDPENGVRVYMYKDKPGHYFDIFGRPISEKMASKVGFPVDQLKKERVRNERMAFAKTTIDKELGPGMSVKDRILFTQGDFSLIDRGLGRVDVTDSSGNTYNPQPLPYQVGERLVAALSGQDATPKNPQEVLEQRARDAVIEGKAPEPVVPEKALKTTDAVIEDRLNEQAVQQEQSADEARAEQRKEPPVSRSEAKTAAAPTLRLPASPKVRPLA